MLLVLLKTHRCYYVTSNLLHNELLYIRTGFPIRQRPSLENWYFWKAKTTEPKTPRSISVIQLVIWYRSIITALSSTPTQPFLREFDPHTPCWYDKHTWWTSASFRQIKKIPYIRFKPTVFYVCPRAGGHQLITPAVCKYKHFTEFIIKLKEVW